MKSFLQSFIGIALASSVSFCFAQAPTISYNSPQSYLLNSSVFISPSTNGVAAPGYTTTPVLLGSGISGPISVAVDAAGNVFALGFNETYLREIPASGGAMITLGSGFAQPFDLTTDGAGNIYVADTFNNAVKKIMAGSNSVSTVASGFNHPEGVAVDAAGNVYVSDGGNNAVKKISALDLSITTIGSGFLNPVGVAVDLSGNVYVADYGNHAVKKIPTGSNVPVVIGSDINSPGGLFVDPNGNLYVTDYGTKVVKEILAGTNTTITLSAAATTPYKAVTDATGNLFVADYNNTSIEKYVPLGGYYINKPLPAGLQFDYTTGVISGIPTAVMPSTIYTISTYNSHGRTQAHVALEIKAPAPPTVSYGGPQSYMMGAAVAITPSSSGVSAATNYNSPVLLGSGFTTPTGVAEDAAGNIYVADYNAAVKKIPAGGGAPVSLGSGFSRPFDVAVDAAGNLYVVDLDLTVIKELPAGSNTFINKGAGFDTPSGIAIDASGNIYVTNSGVNYVEKVLVNSNLTLVLGSGFNGPQGVAVDAYGNIYVSDTNNNAVKKIPVGSSVPVTIGSGFSLPNGVAVDAIGNVFVADYGSKSIKEILAGTNTTITISNGLVNPYKLTIDGTGNLIVADANSSAIKKLAPLGGYYINKVLPAGLTFNNTTGIISGTPTAPTPPTDYMITAYNAGGGRSTTLNMATTVPPAPVLTYNTPQSYLINQSVSLSPSSQNSAPAVYSSGTISIGSGFSNSSGIAVDLAGNIYVVGIYSATIKKIPADGSATVSIGSGLSQAFDITVDAAGNLYVAELTGTKIKKFPAGSNTPVLMGNGLNQLGGVAVDPSGNIYVADYGNNAVKMILADNSSTVAVGSGFSMPEGVALDAAGNIYVADYGHFAIKKIAAGTNTVTTVGTNVGDPSGIAIDASGNIFEVDYSTSTIKEILAGTNAAVTINTIAVAPYKIAIDGTGALLVTDYTSTSIKKITPLGGYYINKFLPKGLTFSNATGTISGTPTAASPLTNYTVSGYNAGGLDSTHLKIQVNATASTNAFLSGLTVNGTLSPVFAQTTYAYSVGVASNVTGVMFKPTAADAGAYITINGNAVASGDTTEDMPLVTGSNIFNIVVTAQDGTTTQTYTVTVTNQSNDATLANLVLSSGTLSPAFASGTTSYTATVTNATSSITLTPTKSNNFAAIKINNTFISSGHATAALPLVVGANAIPVTVIAQDGTTKIYNLTVTRQPQGFNTATLSYLTISSGTLSPGFTTGTVGYTDTVSNTTTSVKLTPTVTVSGATIKVNGTAVTSGTASQSISLVEGNNIISTVITAQDGSTVKTYTIKLLRKSSNADLSALTISSGALSPVFGSNTLAYTTTVSNATASVTITPTKANAFAGIKVNTGFVSSGKPTAAIPLKVGTTTITIIIYAQNGITTKTYTISVLRESNDATLSSLTLSSGTLSPAFASGTTSYTASVSNATSSIALTPTKNNAYAAIKINGAYVSSGHATSVSLVVGTNTIPVMVIAQDGTTKTYTLTITRAVSGMNNLYLPGDNEQTPLVSSRTEKVEANNILSPNGDGYNDIWVVKNIAFYPNNTVSVYNKAGELVFTKKGYANDWDGTYRGSVLSEGTYYYSIDLGNGNINKGFITVVNH